MHENERLVEELETDWNDKVKDAQELITEKVVELQGLGVIHAANPTGISAPKQPHLVNLSPDPALSECLLYIIATEGETVIGSADNRNWWKFEFLFFQEKIFKISKFFFEKIHPEKVR